ncbi:MAG: hypothetical protein SGILL_010308, partial [Bacillariaceae sp.]
MAKVSIKLGWTGYKQLLEWVLIMPGRTLEVVKKLLDSDKSPVEKWYYDKINLVGWAIFVVERCGNPDSKNLFDIDPRILVLIATCDRDRDLSRFLDDDKNGNGVVIDYFLNRDGSGLLASATLSEQAKTIMEADCQVPSYIFRNHFTGEKEYHPTIASFALECANQHPEMMRGILFDEIVHDVHERNAHLFRVFMMTLVENCVADYTDDCLILGILQALQACASGPRPKYLNLFEEKYSLVCRAWSKVATLFSEDVRNADFSIVFEATRLGYSWDAVISDLVKGRYDSLVHLDQAEQLPAFALAAAKPCTDVLHLRFRHESRVRFDYGMLGNPVILPGSRKEVRCDCCRKDCYVFASSCSQNNADACKKNGCQECLAEKQKREELLGVERVYQILRA